MTSRTVSRPVCILGLGLIGGSLLRDLAAADVAVFGYNRSPSGARAARGEGFDVSDDLTATLTRAEDTGALIVLAVPMPAIPGLLDAIATHAPHCGITDVVSVKAQVWEEVCARGMQDRYVGGHPMAGTADSGWSAAQQGLFDGAAWVVTFDRAMKPGSSRDVDPHLPQEWIDLWVDVATLATLVGAQVIPARVEQHDKAVARISHLPHVLAETLAIVGDTGGALTLSLAAGSFRDGTRVAGSSPSLVRAMCETNHHALVTALDEAIALLQDARAGLTGDSPSVEELVDAGYRSRVRYEARSRGYAGRPVLRVRPGQPGWVGQLLQAEDVGARVDVF
ncbi:prephenate dehydrogenase [Corynebacterium sp. 13CS0277]|uniref:prephenate dehydrogenase n=1 Tax=Corynebacterium sp. 13CS0277 TaxID=2071994 RepID=UPI000D024AC8|nr:prephenate dehydrogenase [Corynebacterium sp. 13CS0277]PRQ10304.1 prephenate dehydrogenase [Corynebacterium sp. 13CS0277]